MKKFSNQKDINKIAKATLAMVLAGSFTFSASKAFADGNPSDSNQTTVQTEASSTTVSAEKQETPTLLPGDFFYFVKIAFEKIQLALTFDHTNEAKLLAENASERLAEAEALFKEGKQEEAIATIKESLKAMSDSNKLVKQDETDKDDNQEAATTQQTAATGVQTTTSTDNQNTATTTASQSAASADDQNTTTTTDDQTTASSENQGAEDDGIKEVQNVLAHNIIALKAALEHVKNPVARAALQKNIDKTYARLAEKLNKVEEHLADEQKKGNHEKDEQKDSTKDDTKTFTEGQTAVNATSNKADQATASQTTQTKVSVKDKTKAVTVTKEEKYLKTSEHDLKNVHQAVQQKHQQVKAIVEQKREEIKQKVKEAGLKQRKEHENNQGHKQSNKHENNQGQNQNNEDENN